MKIEFNLIRPLAQLEIKNGRRYTYTDIARKAKVNRQTVRNLMTEPPDQINVHTLGGLLDFFAAEGMPIGVADLFTVDDTGGKE
jgi:hypothetical protein